MSPPILFKLKADVLPANPPHFHVEFQGEKATFSFDGQLLSGTISSGTARRLVRECAVVTNSNLR